MLYCLLNDKVALRSVCLIIETFTVGMLQTNCYVVSCDATKEAIIIDPGLDFPPEAQPIQKYIEQSQLKVKFIVNTHGHSDHIQGDRVFQAKFEVPICIHKLDAYFLEILQTPKTQTQILLEDASAIQFGKETLKVLHTPGHTSGSICLIGEKVMFSGDTLFACSIGRTDFVEGSPSDMKLSLEKLRQLKDNLLVYPGHGEATLMGEEKRVNPFLTGRFEF
jgi:hydroxyacylglutathione hydrolase